MTDVTVGIRLVALDSTHLAATLNWMRDPRLRRQLDSLGEPTEAGHTAYWQARFADSRAENYAIIDTMGRHVGNCGLRDIDEARRKAELWIYLSEQRGAGLGSAAMALLLEHAFGDGGLNRVYLRVLANNMATERFYRRLGFVVEGHAREDSWCDGQPVDATLMSILAREHAAGGRAGR